MKNISALKVSSLAVCTAIVAVFTLVVKIPLGTGYLNLCDLAIAFIAFTLGPMTAFISAAFGTAIADVVSAYPQWAIISFLSHGLEALAIALIIKKSDTIITQIIAGLVGIIIMVGGYYLLGSLFLEGFSASLTLIPGNLAQGAFGIVFGLVISQRVKKAYPLVSKLSW